MGWLGGATEASKWTFNQLSFLKGQLSFLKGHMDLAANLFSSHIIYIIPKIAIDPPASDASS